MRWLFLSVALLAAGCTDADFPMAPSRGVVSSSTSTSQPPEESEVSPAFPIEPCIRRSGFVCP